MLRTEKKNCKTLDKVREKEGRRRLAKRDVLRHSKFQRGRSESHEFKSHSVSFESMTQDGYHVKKHSLSAQQFKSFLFEDRPAQGEELTPRFGAVDDLADLRALNQSLFGRLASFFGERVLGHFLTALYSLLLADSELSDDSVGSLHAAFPFLATADNEFFATAYQFVQNDIQLRRFERGSQQGLI